MARIEERAPAYLDRLQRDLYEQMMYVSLVLDWPSLTLLLVLLALRSFLLRPMTTMRSTPSALQTLNQRAPVTAVISRWMGKETEAMNLGETKVEKVEEMAKMVAMVETAEMAEAVEREVRGES